MLSHGVDIELSHGVATVLSGGCERLAAPVGRPPLSLGLMLAIGLLLAGVHISDSF